MDVTARSGQLMSAYSGSTVAPLLGWLLGVAIASGLALYLLLGVVLPALDRVRDRAVDRLRQKPISMVSRLALAVLDPHDEVEPLILLGVPLVAVVVSFGNLAKAVAAGTGLAKADAAISAALQDLRSGPADAVMVFLTGFGDWPVITLTTTAFVLWMWHVQGWRLGLGVAIVMGLSTALASALKAGFAIPRPSEIYQGVQAFSFPSGHTTSSFTLFGLLAWLAWYGAGTRSRTAHVFVFSAIAGTIAASRLYLGAHWPSDVAGGALLGAGLVLLFALTNRRVRLKPSAQGLALVVGVFVLFGATYSLTEMSASMMRYAPPAGQMRGDNIPTALP